MQAIKSSFCNFAKDIQRIEMCYGNQRAERARALALRVGGVALFVLSAAAMALCVATFPLGLVHALVGVACSAILMNVAIGMFLSGVDKSKQINCFIAN